MAKTTTLPITQTIQTLVVGIVNATSFIAANGGTAPTNTVLLLTAGADGSVVKSIMISSDDSAAKQVSFYISVDSGTTKYLLGTVNVAAGAGLTSGTTSNVDVLGNYYLIGLPVDQSNKPIIELKAGAQIYAGAITAAVTSGRTLHVIAQMEDY
jgi:hypothetical protein